MKKKSWMMLLTLILVIGTVLAGCGSAKETTTDTGSKTEEGTTGTDKGTTTEPAGDATDANLAADQTLHLNLSAEPPTLDPAQAQDSQSNTALRFMYEGLAKIDADGNPEGGAAENWDISEDGLTYTFHMRQGAKWSNGDPVTANDFVYAWQRVLSPETTPAPVYAYQLYYIKGAEDFNTGKTSDFSTVGVKAVDENTLEVTLVNPTPYFLGLTSFYTYYPVHQASVEADEAWATDASKMVTNGPFTLTTWTTGSEMGWTKNEQYWDAASIKLTNVTASIVNSGATETASYQSGEIDYAGAPTGEIPTDQIQPLSDQLKDEFKLSDIASTYYYEFNNKEKPFDNAKIRKAFAMSIDRQSLIDNVTKAGQTPAYGFVPTAIAGLDNKSFREMYPDSGYLTEDVEQAKTLLAEGMKEEGLTKLPPITLLYNTSENHQKLALAVADMWEKNLGVTIETKNEEWSVFLETRKTGNYQIARAGWSADYDDPMTYLDMYVTDGGNNTAFYSNENYDKLIAEAYKGGNDPAKRMQELADAEKQLIGEDTAIIPVYYYTQASLTKPYLKGVTTDFSGAINFTRAYLEEH
ncbi:peptide ABC transporter substrate-binding protein [Saccharibacillus sp. CPCC 101409]|uniref:peptide ABC transporter substrate-binding protein n=1 Tax=Saccharibacillus sp. CPCC 101409 TaxID=3058041 RepID=UPI002671DA2D|nr:peptide ABC transporter substrate-binding protein [Saccharibacillus sp. CPCC 101409]MDO3409198.1 peptide ABC transporter substrate-binding protein [Saccharibacillus sp. CPCC 101409]